MMTLQAAAGSREMFKGVFVWAFFSFPLKKASKMKQRGGFRSWLFQSQSTW
jgi:hypothetical protein